jgi:ComF family protein
MSLLNFLFPPRCAVCREFTGGEAPICASCEESWPCLQHPFCVTCAEPFASGPDHRCGACLSEPPAFDRLQAAGLYEGLLLDLVVRLKYRSEERLASFLGRRMADALPTDGNFDLILPVPLHVSRLRERGFNQSVLLARRVGKWIGVKADLLLLRKDRPTPPQATLHVEERRKNLRGAFRLEDAARVRGKTVLLVDDVATTGATLNEAARVLKKAGAERVEAIVAARAA